MITATFSYVFNCNDIPNVPMYRVRAPYWLDEETWLCPVCQFPLMHHRMLQVKNGMWCLCPGNLIFTDDEGYFYGMRRDGIVMSKGQ